MGLNDDERSRRFREVGQGQRRPARARALTDAEAEQLNDGEAVPIPVGPELDLHPFAPRQVAPLVTDWLTACAAAGLDDVRIVHGKGLGVLRRTVRKVLATHPHVRGFHDAPPHRGGWGATVVRLHRIVPGPNAP